MSAKIYKIKLTEDERKELVAKRDGKFTKATILKRCIALLMADEGYFGPSHIDAEIRTATGLSLRTIERLRLRCCEVGPVAALLAQPREQSPLKVKITGEIEARITQLACSQPPTGHVRWTLRLMAAHLVEIEVIENISHTSVATILKKVNSSHGDNNNGASHPSKMPHL